MFFQLLHWLRRFLRPARPICTRPAALRLDCLEERTLPSTSTPLNGSSWTSLGPANVSGTTLAGATSGEITAIAPDPSNINRVLIGTGGGGVWGTTDEGQTWQPLTSNTPGGTGYIGALTIDPDNPNNVYAGTGDPNLMPDSYAGKGILKSTDGGKTWTLVGQQFAGYSISKIVVDWENSNTIYATVTRGALGAVPDPAGNDGLWRSTDGGQTWVNLIGGKGSPLAGTGNLAYTDLLLDPQSETLFVAVGEPSGNAANGVYYSTDAVNPANTSPTFTLVTGLPSGTKVGRISLASGWRSSYTTDWAEISDPSGHLLSLAQTRNGNPTWTDATSTVQDKNGKNQPEQDLSMFLDNTGSPVNSGNYTLALAVDPNNTDFVTMGGGEESVIVPKNDKDPQLSQEINLLQNYYYNGPISIPTMNWAAVNEAPWDGTGSSATSATEPFHHVLVYDHFGNLYDGTDTGLYRFNGSTGVDAKGDPFTDGSWTNLNTNLAIGQFLNVGLSPDSNDTMLGGIRGVGGVTFQDKSGWAQNGFFGPDETGRAIVDPRNSKMVYQVYTGTLDQTTGVFFSRSSDGGQTFQTQEQGLGLSDTRDPMIPMVLDVPTDQTSRPARLLLGTDRLYVNYSPEQNNNSWTVLNYSIFQGSTIYGIGASPSDVNTIYLGVGNTVQATTDNGLTWHPITPSGAAPQAVFPSFVVDPSSPQTVYTVSPNSGNGRVWSTSDGGKTWTEISNNLPAGADPWSITFLPPFAQAPNGVLLLGTDAGVFYSLNRGASWNQMGLGLPNVAVRDLQYNPNLDTLAAATYGRGIWEMNLKGVNQPPVNTVPGAQSVSEDTPLPFNGNISVADPDANGNPEQVSLSVTNGTLTLKTTDGLTFSAGTGTNDVAMTFTGTLDKINAALNGMVYMPTGGYSGSDTLTLTTNDLGHSGGPFSGPQSTTSTVAITVTPIHLSFESSPPNMTAGGVLPTLKVDVLDQSGNADPSAVLQVTIAPNGPGGLSGGSTTVNVAGGVATFSGLVLQKAGTYTLSAASVGVNPGNTASFTVSPAAPSQLGFEANPANTTAGTPLPDLKVDVLDAYGNVVPSSTAKVSIAANGPGSLSGGDTTVQSAGGVATFKSLVLKQVGTYTLTVSSSGLTAATTPSFTVSPGGDGAVVFEASPGTSTAGAPLPTLKVDVLDAYGNPEPNSSATITLSANGPGALNGTLTAQASAGVATFSGLVLQTAGNYTLTASATGLQPGNTAAFTVSAAAPDHLAFEASPHDGSVGPLPTIKVDVLDIFGNLANGSTVQVVLAANGPGALTGTTTITTASGVAAFTGLGLQKAGAYSLTATAGSLPPVTSDSFTISPGAPAGLAFEAALANASTVHPLPPFKVDVVDTYGNLVPSATNAVTVTANGPGTFSQGTTSQQASSGVATFSDLVLPTAGTYTLTTAAQGLQPNTSTSFTISAPIPTSLAFEAPVPDTTAAQALPDVKVDVLDQFGQLYTNQSLQVTLAIGGPGPATGGSTSVASANGVATFSGLTFQKAGSYTLAASAANTQAATSNAFAVNPGAANHLAFEANPANMTAGPLPTVNVDVLDAYGNPLTTTSTTVSLAATGPGPLTGTTSMATVNGVAAFNAVGLAQVGSYTLTASAGTLTPVTTASFTVSPGPAATFLFPTTPAGTTAGQALADFTVNVVDAYGNLVASNAPVTIAPSVPGGIQGTTTVTAQNGTATFHSISLLKAGTYPLIASSPNLTPANSAPLTTSPASATNLMFEAVPAKLSAGQSLALRVDVVDAYGNVVSGSSVPVTLAPGSAGAISTSSPTVGASGGVATFQVQAATKTGSYSIAALAPGVASSSAAFTVVAGAPAKLVWATSPPSVPVGATLPDLQINVEDTYGNLVTDGTIPVTLTSSGAGKLNGTTTVLAVNGVATFSGLSLSGSGSHTLSASTPGVAAAASAPFDVTTASATKATPPAPRAHLGAGSRLRFLGLHKVALTGQPLGTVKVQLVNRAGQPLGTKVLVKLQLVGKHQGWTVQKLTDANGMASFAGLSVPAPGQYNLVATVAGLPTTTSPAITVHLGRRI